MNREQLIDHLDSTHLGNGSVDMDTRISEDPETALEWNQLRLAVDAVEQAAIYEKVHTIRTEWLSRQSVAATTPAAGSGAVIRSISRTALRAAAVLFIIGSSAAIYKYTVTGSTGLYSTYCTPYELNTSRGAATRDEMEEAYKNKNWAAVTDGFKKKKVKDNKSYFLAGMADLETKKYDDAIGMFQQVMAANSLSGSDYFEDEAEFYLAMSWLARNDIKEAMPLLDKIRADKTHQYHDIVVKMSSLDLRIAEYKDLK